MNHGGSGYGKRLKLAALLLALALAIGGITATAIALSGALDNRAYAQSPPSPQDALTRTLTPTPRPTPVPKCEFLVGTHSNRGKIINRPMQFSGAQGSSDFSPLEREDGQFDAVNIYGDALCQWAALPNVDWIKLNNSSSSGIVQPDQSTENLRFEINSEVARKLPPGTYKGLINFSVASGDPGPGRILYVELYILAPCQLTVQTDADFLRFEMQAGDNHNEVPPGSITISNAYQAGDCIWRARPRADSLRGEWLRVTPSEGRLRGGQTVSLRINPTGAVSKLEPADTDYDFSVDFTTENGLSESVEGALRIEPAPCRLEISLAQDVFEVAGQQGGPFTPEFIGVGLRNTGGRPCNWHTTDGRYFRSAELGGTLDPLKTYWFRVLVRESAANAPPGEHPDKITVVKAESSESNEEVALKLKVSPLPCQFTARAVGILKFQRTPEGTHNPANANIEIANAEYRDTCSWAAASPDWLTVNPDRGQLTAGETKIVTVSVAADRTDNLPQQQTHQGTLRFVVPTESETNDPIPVELELQCRKNQPCFDFHSSQIDEISYRDEVVLTLTMRNPPTRRALTVTLALDPPSGWSLAAGDFGDCGSGCSKTYEIPAGQDENIFIVASPTAPSHETKEYSFTGSATWLYENGDEATRKIAIPVTVKAATPEEWEEFQRATSTPPPTLTPTPAPTPTPMPTATAVPPLPTPEPTPTPTPTPVVAPTLPDGSTPSSAAAPTPSPFWQDWRIWGAAFVVAIVVGAAVVGAFMWGNRRDKGRRGRGRRRGRRRRRSPRSSQNHDAAS